MQNENKKLPLWSSLNISSDSLFIPTPPLPPPLFLFAPSPLVYYNSSIKEQWLTERPPNHRDIPTIGREKEKGGVSAEVWKPSITEGLKLTSQQDMSIRMQIWAGHGQQMPSGAVKRARRAHERTYAMWETLASRLSLWNPKKNRKLN